MAPYLLLGLTFAGILHIVFKKELIVKHLGDNNIMASAKAAVLGVPLPLCSCGVIPTALSLRKNNASEGATLSFLISTPQTGVDSIIATYGMLGPVFAVFRPIAALLMGIFGGVITSILGNDATIQKNTNTIAKKKENDFSCTVCPDTEKHSHSLIEKIIAMVKYAYGSFLDDISIQLVVGVIISGIISYFLPDDFFVNYVSSGILGMLIMIVAGIPLYVCATASIPIAATLMMKGLSPGAAFVFLAVGPATNAATITLIANVMGKKIVAIYLSVISIGAIISGYALNFTFDVINIDPAFHATHQHHETISIYGIIFTAIFSVMLLLSLSRKLMPLGKKTSCQDNSCSCGSQNAETEIEKMFIFKIQGMTCNHCANHVQEAILGVDGVVDVTVKLGAKEAVVVGHYDNKSVLKVVGDAGYLAIDPELDNKDRNYKLK